MPDKTKHMHFKHLPSAIDAMIINEQHRLGLFEQLQLNREFVVYRMLNDWYEQKNIIAQLREEIEKLKNKLVIE